MAVLTLKHVQSKDPGKLAALALLQHASAKDYKSRVDDLT